MADVNDVLAANRAAVNDLVAAAERSAATWTTPRAPGKRERACDEEVLRFAATLKSTPTGS
jgi:hypothetical protein